MILLLSLVYTCNLAQNHTLFYLLVFTAVCLYSLEDDDKIKMRVQADSPWKSALKRGSSRYTQEAFFPDGVCWDRAGNCSLEGGSALITTGAPVSTERYGSPRK